MRSVRPMKLIAAAVIIAAAVVATYRAAGVYRRPVLVFSSDRIDLGVRTQGTHSVTITLQNQGRSDLRIDKVVSTCGCTVVGRCDTVPAGESRTLPCDLGIGGGAGSAQLAIFSNAVNRVATVRINWYGEATPVLVPSRITARLARGGTIRRRVSVVGAAGADISFSGARSTCEGIVCKAAPVFGSASRLARVVPGAPAHTESAEFDLDINVRDGIGNVRGAALVTCESKGRKYSLPLTLSIDLDRPVALRPASLFLTSSGDQPLKGKTLTTRAVVAEASSDIQVKSAPEFLSCTVTDQGAGVHDVEMAIISEPPPLMRRFTLELYAGTAVEMIEVIIIRIP